MDPSLIMAGASIVGKAMQTPPATSGADGGLTNVEAVFDNSGWTVNFGDNAEQNAERSQLPAVGSGFNTTMVVIAVAGLIAWKMWTKTRKK